MGFIKINFVVDIFKLLQKWYHYVWITNFFKRLRKCNMCSVVAYFKRIAVSYGFCFKSVWAGIQKLCAVFYWYAKTSEKAANAMLTYHYKWPHNNLEQCFFYVRKVRRFVMHYRMDWIVLKTSANEFEYVVYNCFIDTHACHWKTPYKNWFKEKQTLSLVSLTYG